MQNQLIKFRGIHTKTNQFIYGSLLLINGDAYIYDRDYGDLNDIDFGGAFEQVKLETVGQFTGLCDKNGKPVYEGDIFKQEILMTPDAGNRHNDGTYWIDCLCVVVFVSEQSRFCGKYEFKKLNIKSDFIDYSRFTNRSGFIDVSSSVKVIGNIYENPELLENK